MYELVWTFQSYSAEHLFLLEYIQGAPDPVGSMSNSRNRLKYGQLGSFQQIEMDLFWSYTELLPSLKWSQGGSSYAHRLVSKMIVDPVKVTVNINRHFGCWVLTMTLNIWSKCCTAELHTAPGPGQKVLISMGSLVLSSWSWVPLLMTFIITLPGTKIMKIDSSVLF